MDVTEPVLLARQDSVIILLLMYPGISGQAMKFFRCQEIDQESYLEADYGSKCYDTAWWAFFPLIVCVLLILAVGTPVAMWWILFRHRFEIWAEAKIKQGGDADEVEDGESATSNTTLSSASSRQIMPIEDGVAHIDTATTQDQGGGESKGDTEEKGEEEGDKPKKTNTKRTVKPGGALAVLYRPYRPEMCVEC